MALMAEPRDHGQLCAPQSPRRHHTQGSNSHIFQEQILPGAGPLLSPAPQCCKGAPDLTRGPWKPQLPWLTQPLPPLPEGGTGLPAGDGEWGVQTGAGSLLS